MDSSTMEEHGRYTAATCLMFWPDEDDCLWFHVVSRTFMCLPFGNSQKGYADFAKFGLRRCVFPVKFSLLTCEGISLEKKKKSRKRKDKRNKKKGMQLKFYWLCTYMFASWIQNYEIILFSSLLDHCYYSILVSDLYSLYAVLVPRSSIYRRWHSSRNHNKKISNVKESVIFWYVSTLHQILSHQCNSISNNNKTIHFYCSKSKVILG